MSVAPPPFSVLPLSTAVEDSGLETVIGVENPAVKKQREQSKLVACRQRLPCSVSVLQPGRCQGLTLVLGISSRISCANVVV